MNEITKKSNHLSPREKEIREIIRTYKSIHEIAGWVVKNAAAELLKFEKSDGEYCVVKSRSPYTIYQNSEAPSLFIKKNRNEFNLICEEVLSNAEYPLKKLYRLCFKLGFYLEWLVTVYLDQIKDEKLNEYGPAKFHDQTKERQKSRIEKNNEAFSILMNFSVCSENLLRAKYYAKHKHGGQLYGRRPYSFHLDSVSAVLRIFDDNELQVIGYLHDILEDTETRKEEMIKYFGVYVTRCVKLLTDPEGNTRAIRKEKSHEKLSAVRTLYTDALIVKAADRLSNIRMCVKDENYKKLLMYKMEHDDFKKAVYRPGLCDALWSEINEIMNRRDWLDE